MLPKLQAYVLNVLESYAVMRHRTPEEHCASAWWYSSRADLPRRVSAPCIDTLSSSPLNDNPKLRSSSPPTGHVRVKFFLEPTYQKIMDQCCVFADFPLDAEGGLDFSAVRRKWGLSTCTVIRYGAGEGMRSFIPRCQHKLLPKEVRVMRGHDKCISIVEEPHDARTAARAKRIHWLDRLSSLQEEFYDYQLPILILAVLLALAIFAWSRLDWHAWLAVVASEMAFIYVLPQIVAFCLGPPRTTSHSGLVQIIWS